MTEIKLQYIFELKVMKQKVVLIRASYQEQVTKEGGIRAETITWKHKRDKGDTKQSFGDVSDKVYL